MHGRRLLQRERQWVLGLAFSASLAATWTVARESAAEPPPVVTGEPGREAARLEAKSRYDEGVAAYRERRFDAAIAAFLAADELAPRAANAYNVACAYDRLNEPRLAAEYYRRYLAQAPTAANAGAVRAKLSALDTAHGEPQQGALVAARDPGAAPPPVATSDAPARAPPPPPPTPTPTPDRRGAEPGGGRASPAIMIAGGTLTLLGIGAGIAFQMAAEHEDERLDQYRSELGPAGCAAASPPPECESVKAAAERYDLDRTLSLVGFATASAAAVGTFVYWILSDAAPAARGSTAPRNIARLRFDGVFTSSGAVLGVRGTY